MRVKICGITSCQDAEFVAASGADAIGLVFYEKSPRNVSVKLAAEICASLPPFLNVVGLFVNMPASEVRRILEQVPLDLLQFHGAESAIYCDSFQKPYIKAVPMMGLEDFFDYVNEYKNAKGFLVDSHSKDTVGGSGKTFDWSKIPESSPKPIILAGGLNPENAANAVQLKHIYALDVSSGVERSPGIKSQKKIYAFMQEVKRGIQ